MLGQWQRLRGGCRGKGENAASARVRVRVLYSCGCFSTHSQSRSRGSCTAIPVVRAHAAVPEPSVHTVTPGSERSVKGVQRWGPDVSRRFASRTDLVEGLEAESDASQLVSEVGPEQTRAPSSAYVWIIGPSTSQSSAMPHSIHLPLCLTRGGRLATPTPLSTPC